MLFLLFVIEFFSTGCCTPFKQQSTSHTNMIYLSQVEFRQYALISSLKIKLPGTESKAIVY